MILQDKVNKTLVRAQLWGKNCFLDQVSLLIEEMVTNLNLRLNQINRVPLVMGIVHPFPVKNTNGA